MPVYGKVTAVTEEATGTTLATDIGTLLGAPGVVLSLDDVSQLAWPTGTLKIGDDEDFDVRQYTVDNLPDQTTYELQDDEVGTDIEAGTVTLSAAVSTLWKQDTRVVQYPDVLEKLATVMIPGQQEELTLRVPQHLTDRLPTGIREDPDDADNPAADSETVELDERDDDWVMVDLVSQTGTGQDRGYDANAAVVNIAGSFGAAITLCQVPIVIPSPQHRILVWYSANLTAPNNGTIINLFFDDAGFDFAVNGVTLVTFTANNAIGYDVPMLIMPLLAQLDYTSTPGTTGIVGGHISGGFLSEALPTTFMPYTITPPTPGLHNFRLRAWAFGTAGPATVATSKLWITVI